MQCPVCLDDNIDARACVMRCGHHICNYCIVKLEKPICPTCRAPIFPDSAAPAPAPDSAIDSAYFHNGALMDEDSHPRAQGGGRPRTWPLPSRPLGLRASGRAMDAPSADDNGSLILPPGANPPHLQRQFSLLTYSPYRSSSYR